MRLGGFLAAFALAAATAAAESPSGAVPLPALGSRFALAQMIGSARQNLEIRMPQFDDLQLQKAAYLAVSRGVQVRLLLSRRLRANRLAAPDLRVLGLQLRWANKKEAAYLIADCKEVLLCAPDGSGDSLDFEDHGLPVGDERFAEAQSREFEKEWRKATESIPEEMALKDQLEALPDPRQTEPHVRTKRRKL